MSNDTASVAGYRFAPADSPLARWARGITDAALAAVGASSAPTQVLVHGDWLFDRRRWMGLCRAGKWICLNGEALGMTPQESPHGATAELGRLILIHECAHWIQRQPSPPHRAEWRRACRKLGRALGMSLLARLPTDERCRQWPHAATTAKWSFAHRPQHKKPPRERVACAPRTGARASNAAVHRILPRIATLILCIARHALARRQRLARRIAARARSLGLEPASFLHHATWSSALDHFILVVADGAAGAFGCRDLRLVAR